MAEATIGAPVDFDPFAKGRLPPGYDRISPDVQAQRDKVASNLQAKEAAGTGGIPTDTVVAGAPRATPAQIAEFSGQVSTPNRGGKIAAEVRRKPVVEAQPKPTVTVGPPVDYDPFATDASGVVPSDYTKSAAAGALSGAGMIAQGGGELLARGINMVGDKLGFDQKVRAVNPLQGWVNDLLDNRTPAAKKAEANTQISGELLKPSEWNFGKDPTVAGIALQGMNAIGQFAPNLAVALVTAGASIPVQLGIGATVGGLQALGGGAGEERAKFQGMKHGELMGASELYRELVGRGVPQNQAKDAVAEAAALGGGLGNAIPSAGEGAFENFLIGALTRGKIKIPSLGAGVAGRMATGAVGGAAMGGTEEALEQASQNLGSNVAVGGNRPLGTDTLQQFVMGMIAEGVAGGGAGALSKSPQPATVPPAPAATNGANQPAPTAAPPDSPPAGAAPSPQPPKQLGFQAGEPLVVFPDGSTMTRAQYEQERANGMVHAEPVKEVPAPAAPDFSVLAGNLNPIDQARLDSQTLKAGGSIEDPSRLKNATLVAVYGENAAVRHVVEGGQQFSAVGDAMLAAAPMVERVRGTMQAGQQNRDITDDILGAVDELAKIKASGQDVAQVLAHGVPHDISYEGQQLLQFLHENADNSKRIADFLERYLHEVEMASGVPSQVRGRAFDIIEERNAARKADAEAKQSERKDAAFKAEEKKVKSDKLETTKLANEQHRAEIVLQTIARAKASGSGINSEHMTAMELAFAKAQLKKGDNGKPKAGGSIQGSTTGGPQGGAGPVQAGSGKGTVSKPAETRDKSDARPVRPGEPAKSAQGDGGRGRVIADERSRNRNSALPLGRNADVVPSKVIVNSGSGNVHSVGNFLDIESLRTKGFSDLDIPSQRMVLRAVVAGAHDPKILDSVIGPDVINMVNVLGGKKFSSEMLRHHPSVLKNILAISKDVDISSLANKPEFRGLLGKISFIANTIAELPVANDNVVGPAESGSTPTARNGSPAASGEAGFRAENSPLSPRLLPSNGDPAIAAGNNNRGAPESATASLAAKEHGGLSSKKFDSTLPANFSHNIPDSDLSVDKTTTDINSSVMAFTLKSIPASLKITLPVLIEESGETVQVEMNARKAFRESQQRVTRLKLLLECLT